MRVLVASTTGSGHFGPLVPFLDALRRRGDEVLLVVPPGLAATVEAAGHPFRIGADPPAGEVAAIWDRFPAAPPAEAAILVDRELFGRLGTAAMLPALEEACRGWAPDLVLREPCAYAAAVGADRIGIPHAQVAISLARVESSALELAAPALEPYGSGLVERIRAAPYLTRFPGSLDPSPWADTRRFREADGAEPEPLPHWWDEDDAPLLYVTFGSVTGTLPLAAAAYRTALEAVAGLPLRVLLTVGRDVDPAVLGPVPDSVHVEPWVPQAAVLAQAELVLCHGGSGTTFGALAAGVPLVIVPLFADQPRNARLVAGAGAALVVEPSDRDAAANDRIGPGDAPQIRAAVESVLADPSYRRAAGRLAAELRRAPAVDELLDGLRPPG